MGNEADSARTDNGMEHFGYRESLDRGIGKFGSFAAGVSYISILTGTFQLFYFGFGTAGPAYLWSWPMVLIGQLTVALCFMELAAKYPVAGSVYNWSKQLGSRIVSWSAGWLMLTASIVTLSAVVLALQLNLPRLWSGFQIVGDGSGAYDFATNAVILGTALILFTTVVNALGVRLMAMINSAGVFIELIAACLIAIILACHATRGPEVFFSANGYGASGGFLGAFLMASLASGYVMYGFDTASSLGEETVEPRRTAPRAILRAILASFVIGGSILVFAILSAPNLSDPQIASSSGGLQYIVEQVMWGPLGKIFLICIVIAVTVCSLAVHTAAIRMTFAMARDNALPFGEKLARVNPKTQTPITPAIVIGVIAALILVVNIGQPKIFTVLTSIAVIMIYLAYLMVTGPMLLKRLRGHWPPADLAAGGYFTMGRWGLLVNVIAVLWGAGMALNLAWPREAIYGTPWYNTWGAFAVHGSDSRSRSVVVRTQGSPLHRHAGLSLSRLDALALCAHGCVGAAGAGRSGLCHAERCHAGTATTLGNTAAPISDASPPAGGRRDPPSCQTVRFSDVGWTDVTSTTALIAQLLRSIGYSPTVTVLSVPVTFASLQNNDLDVFLGNWMPAQAADRGHYVEDGTVVVIGANLTGAKYTLAVPAYTYAAGLKDFKDIQRFGPELNDSIYGIEPGNDGNRHVLDMLKQNQFGLGGFKLVESSEQGMLAQVERAYRDKKPIVFLAWEPHPMNMRFDLKYLAGGDEVLRPQLRRRHHLYRDPQGLQRRMSQHGPPARQSQVHPARRERNDGGDPGPA